MSAVFVWSVQYVVIGGRKYLHRAEQRATLFDSRRTVRHMSKQVSAAEDR